VPGPDDSNDLVPPGKPNGQDATGDIAQTIEPLFVETVLEILENDTTCIEKGKLRQSKRDSVFPLVNQFFLAILFETCLLLHASPSAASVSRKHNHTSFYMHVKHAPLNLQESEAWPYGYTELYGPVSATLQ